MFAQHFVAFFFCDLGVPWITSKQLICALTCQHHLDSVLASQPDSTVYWQRYFNLSCVIILDDVHHFGDQLLHFVLVKFANLQLEAQPIGYLARISNVARSAYAASVAYYFGHHLGSKVCDKHTIDPARKYYPYPLEVLRALFHCLNQCLLIFFNCRCPRSMHYFGLLWDRVGNLKALEPAVPRYNNCTAWQYAPCRLSYPYLPESLAFRRKSYELASISII